MWATIFLKAEVVCCLLVDGLPVLEEITYSGFQFEVVGIVVLDHRYADFEGSHSSTRQVFANQKIKRKKPFVTVEEIHRDIL